MKHKRVVFILAAMVAAFILVCIVWLKVWGGHDVIGTVESVHLPACAQDITDAACGDGTVSIKTEDGAVKEYSYTSEKLGSGDFPIASLQEGAKIKLVVSRGKIVSFEHTK